MFLSEKEVFVKVYSSIWQRKHK